MLARQFDEFAAKVDAVAARTAIGPHDRFDEIAQVAAVVIEPFCRQRDPVRPRECFDPPLDLARKFAHVLRIARRQPDDGDQDGKQIVGPVPQFLRHALVLDNRLARGEQFGDVPLRTEQIRQIAILVVDRADMDRVPERRTVLAVIEDIDDRIFPAPHRFGELYDSRGLGAAPLQEAAIAADNLVAVIASQIDKGLVAIDQRAIVLMRIGDRQRHACLFGRLQE